MKDKVFIDSNIILYAYSRTEPSKREIANALIFATSDALISTQVINEVTNILYKKFGLDSKEIEAVIDEIAEVFSIVNFTLETQKYAIHIKERYQLQYYDSLILATALEHGCGIVYSEDMQHNQLIEDRLRIVNPFRSS